MSDALHRAIVVVGAGQAGAQLVDALRRAGHAGPLALVGEEPHLPYQRPPLSKQYLDGGCDAPWLAYRPDDFYASHGVEVHLGRRVAEIDRAGARIRFEDGGTLPYERLALATGTRVRRLAVPRAQAAGVHYVRTLDDADRLRAALAAARRVVIVGGGFIGLEVAAMLGQQGRDVVVLEAAPRLLPRVAAPELSQFLLSQHRSRGVRIVAGAGVAAIEPLRSGAHPWAVLTTAGEAWPADVIVAGVGVLPNVELAQAAGLECDDGIVVDDAARTSDSAIVAAGDCTRHPNALVGRSLRLETVHNAVEQARVAAESLCDRPARYAQTPWVWSDQYGLRLQMAGLVEGCDSHVVRGVPESGRFSVCYFHGTRLCALQAVNRPAEFAAARRLINARMTITPQQAADPAFDLAGAASARRRLEFAPGWLRRRPPAPGVAP